MKIKLTLEDSSDIFIHLCDDTNIIIKDKIKTESLFLLRIFNKQDDTTYIDECFKNVKKVIYY